MYITFSTEFVRVRAPASASSARLPRTRPPSAPGIGGHVDGVALERVERHDLERPLVRARHHDVRGRAGLLRPQPVQRGHAPAVAGHQAGERELGPRRLQVVADRALVLEELRRDDRADRVAAEVLRPGRAAAVAVEAGQRIVAAGLQRAAEHVAVGHGAEYRAPVGGRYARTMAAEPRAAGVGRRTSSGSTRTPPRRTRRSTAALVRVIERDGQPLPMTMDFREDRMNVVVADGRITAVHSRG